MLNLPGYSPHSISLNQRPFLQFLSFQGAHITGILDRLTRTPTELVAPARQAAQDIPRCPNQAGSMRNSRDRPTMTPSSTPPAMISSRPPVPICACPIPSRLPPPAVVENEQERTDTDSAATGGATGASQQVEPRRSVVLVLVRM